MEKKYQIILNEHQLRLVANCIEDISRFLSGQTELWHATSQFSNYLDLKEKLEELHPLVTPELEKNASYGWSGGSCPVEWQRKKIAETYYIYRTMLYTLHKHDERWNVYTTPALRCEESGEEIIVKEYNESN